MGDFEALIIFVWAIITLYCQCACFADEKYRYTRVGTNEIMDRIAFGVSGGTAMIIGCIINFSIGDRTAGLVCLGIGLVLHFLLIFCCDD